MKRSHFRNCCLLLPVPPEYFALVEQSRTNEWEVVISSLQMPSYEYIVENTFYITPNFSSKFLAPENAKIDWDASFMYNF